MFSNKQTSKKLDLTNLSTRCKAFTEDQLQSLVYALGFTNLNVYRISRNIVRFKSKDDLSNHCNIDEEWSFNFVEEFNKELLSVRFSEKELFDKCQIATEKLKIKIYNTQGTNRNYSYLN